MYSRHAAPLASRARNALSGWVAIAKRGWPGSATARAAATRAHLAPKEKTAAKRLYEPRIPATKA